MIFIAQGNYTAEAMAGMVDKSEDRAVSVKKLMEANAKSRGPGDVHRQSDLIIHLPRVLFGDTFRVSAYPPIGVRAAPLEPHPGH